MSQEEKPYDIAVSHPAPARSSAVNLASIGAASALAPRPDAPEGLATTLPESKPLVSGRMGAALGVVSMLAALAAGFAPTLASVLTTAGVNVSGALLQGGLVVLALASGLVVGKYAVEAPAFAAGRPLVTGPWLALASAGALHLGNLATVLPPGLGSALAVAGAALCCLLAGLPFSRPARK